MQQMTMVEFLKHSGLFVSGEDRHTDLRKLTDEDRAWLKERAQAEFGIEIVAPATK